jgi:hypothetical protein
MKPIKVKTTLKGVGNLKGVSGLKETVRRGGPRAKRVKVVSTSQYKVKPGSMK